MWLIHLSRHRNQVARRLILRGKPPPSKPINPIFLAWTTATILPSATLRMMGTKLQLILRWGGGNTRLRVRETKQAASLPCYNAASIRYFFFNFRFVCFVLILRVCNVTETAEKQLPQRSRRRAHAQHFPAFSLPAS